MEHLVSSFVLRVSHSNGGNDLEDWRIRIRHVQTDQETYLSSLDEVKEYIEEQMKQERVLQQVRKGVLDEG